MRIILVIGCLLGALSVGLGAFGAHALKGSVGEYGMVLWERGTYYQMVHAIMIVITVLAANHFKTTQYFKVAGSLFILGVLCFSGSLYTIALTGIKTFGAVAPVGGFSFMFGWLFLALGFYHKVTTNSH